jgi:hypothetical protein
MPPSETPGGQGRSDLIRDIGRSGTTQGGAETNEHRLMRAAGDPLAVREIMSRLESSGPLPQAAAPMSGEATITLARSILMHGSLDQAHWPQGRMRYDAREALPEDSSPPSAFAPSARDREEALDLEAPSAQAQPAALLSGQHAVLGGLALFVILLWLVVNQSLD